MDERVLVCFGDSNTYGYPPVTTPDGVPRYARDVRWTGLLAAALGPSWCVQEEGLPGRTTVHPDPVDGPHLSGLAALPVVLGTHSPIDTLVIMLGTNDLKARFAVGPADIATSVERLARAARTFCGDSGRPVPRVLVVAPPPIVEVDPVSGVFSGGAEKSRHLAPFLRDAAVRTGAEFLDAGEYIRSSEIDGVHLDADAHRTLAAAIGDVLAGRDVVVDER